MFYIIKVKGLFCIFVTFFNVDSLCNTDYNIFGLSLDDLYYNIINIMSSFYKHF